MSHCAISGEQYCAHDRCWKEWLEELERHPMDERIFELEEEVTELWDRLKQMENVLTTAFGVIANGGKIRSVPTCD